MRYVVVAAALLTAACSGVSKDYSQNPTCYAVYGDDLRRCMDQMAAAHHEAGVQYDAAHKGDDLKMMQDLAKRSPEERGANLSTQQIIDRMDAEERANELDRRVRGAIDDANLCNGISRTAWDAYTCFHEGN